MAISSSIQAQWRVTASDGAQHDQRLVWATDVGTALIVAQEARGWDAAICHAIRVSGWQKVSRFEFDHGETGSGSWSEPTNSWKVTGG